MNIETEDTKNAILKLFATSAQKGLRIVIKRQEDIIWENITVFHVSQSVIPQLYIWGKHWKQFLYPIHLQYDRI